MITAGRDIEDFGRANNALVLLESSGYDEPHRAAIGDQINAGTPDEIELIIQDLLMNQADTWRGFRNKDIQRRLNRC